LRAIRVNWATTSDFAFSFAGTMLARFDGRFSPLLGRFYFAFRLFCEIVRLSLSRLPYKDFSTQRDWSADELAA
jgi:hypothetical protein